MKYRMRDIENFTATSEARTMAEAAKALGISQPALSESIQRLEQDLGTTLFYRTRTGIQLTPEGRGVLEKSKRIIEAVDDLEGHEADGAVFGRRTITIGCHITVANYTLPSALKYLKEQAPDYRISFEHGLSRQVQLSIQQGKVDVGIVINPAQAPDLVIARLESDDVTVWTSEAYKDHDTVICNPELLQTQSILKRWKSKPTRILHTEGLELICRLVGAGLGYGILPERAVRLSGLKIKKVSGAPQVRDEIAIVHRPEFGKTAAEKAVLQSLRYALKES